MATATSTLQNKSVFNEQTDDLHVQLVVHFFALLRKTTT